MTEKVLKHSRSHSASRLGMGVAGIFILFWSAVTLSFDGMMAHGMWQQTRAWGFSETTGRILSSKVHTNVDSDGDTYKPLIRYQYEVAGRAYESEQIRFHLVASGDSYAADMVALHPVGSTTPVFFHPDDPSAAVLIRGIEGSDLFMAMFLTPFNVIMLAGWALALMSLRRTPVPPPGYGVADDGIRCHVHVNQQSPLAVAAATVGGLCFIGVFALGFACGFHPSLELMAAAWAFVFAIAGWTALRTWRANLSGEQDLVLHHLTKEVRIPPHADRKATVRVQATDVIEAGYRFKSEKDSDGDPSTTYPVYLRMRSGPESRYDVVTLSDQAKAEMLAGWLNAEWFGQHATNATLPIVDSDPGRA